MRVWEDVFVVVQERTGHAYRRLAERAVSIVFGRGYLEKKIKIKKEEERDKGTENYPGRNSPFFVLQGAIGCNASQAGG
jgi:hypothetical protein